MRTTLMTLFTLPLLAEHRVLKVRATALPVVARITSAFLNFQAT